MNFAFKTRNCVLKTRKFVLKMTNSAGPTLTLPEKIERLEKLRLTVADMHLGFDPSPQERFPPSPFAQIGPVKVFLRRVAQMATSG